MKIHKEILFERYSPKDSDITYFRVRGDDSMHIRTISVDAEGLWLCSCPSNRFRGICYHVNVIQFELERVRLLKQLKEMRIDPALVGIEEFRKYFALQRFVAEPHYGLHRQYLLIARWVYLDNTRREDWSFEGMLRWAGTVLEGVWDKSDKKSPKFRVFDCLYSKGIDHRYSPLGLRRELAEEAVKALSVPAVMLSDYEYTVEAKQDLVMKHGIIILKDVNSTYDNNGKSPRSWMVQVEDNNYHYGENNARPESAAAYAAGDAEDRAARKIPASSAQEQLYRGGPKPRRASARTRRPAAQTEPVE